ncbi:hypothetical protein ONZ45_g11571 [Pleurotus djamor]|nr:hypothetical protein ONZ45_g11571 [Pleurotus djamor]
MASASRVSPAHDTDQDTTTPYPTHSVGFSGVLDDVFQQKEPRGYINQLTPPTDTSFWRHQTFTPFDQVTVSIARYDLVKITWRIDAYIYVVNAVPNGDFVQKGGQIYVVLVHTGSAQTAGKNIERYDVAWPLTVYFKVSLPSGKGSPVMQLPASNSGSKDGDTWTYNISFTQDFQMFSNGGNQTSTFSAKYVQDISYQMGEQTGDVRSSAAEWSSTLQQGHYDKPNERVPFPFGSMDLWTFNSLEKHDLFCEMYTNQKGPGAYPYQKVPVTIDCQFSA